jgi:DNA-binding MarR family transcriptional regulator
MRGLLEQLLDDRPKTIPELARMLQIPRQFALKLTADLERKELLSRHPNPAHKRSNFVSLTDEGRLLINRILQSEWDALAPIAAQFTEADVTAAVRVLLGVSHHFEVEAGCLHGKR